MLNKDKRSLVLSMVLGDGCLHMQSNRRSGSLTISHCVAQRDWLSWKVAILASVTGRDIKLRSHSDSSLQSSVTMKRFVAWRKWIYPNGKKDKTRILRFIRHPELAMMIWLCDDGHSESKGGRLRLYICDQYLDQVKVIADWVDNNFGVKTVVKTQKSKLRGKEYPFLKWDLSDSLKLWRIIRPKVLGIKSMAKKFQHTEQKYQGHFLQRTAPSGDDIVRP